MFNLRPKTILSSQKDIKDTLSLDSRSSKRIFLSLQDNKKKNAINTDIRKRLLFLGDVISCVIVIYKSASPHVGKEAEYRPLNQQTYQARAEAPRMAASFSLREEKTISTLSFQILRTLSFIAFFIGS